jgi:hypothetical protein
LKEVPLWLNCEKWRALDENGRWNGMQAIALMCGLTTRHSWMAGARGIPEKPPSFVIEEKWLKAAEDDPVHRANEVMDLETHTALDVAISMRATFERAETIKNCQHHFVGAAGVATEACVKCGSVRDVDPRRKTVRA